MPQAKKKTTKKAAKTTKKAATHVVQPGADIVASMADDFKRSLLKMVKTGIPELIIDFTDVDIVDSVGLGVVIATHNSLSNSGGTLKVINVSDDIYQLFKTMRLDQHFEVTQIAA
jgi:anti-sigma B factor antagonist